MKYLVIVFLFVSNISFSQAYFRIVTLSYGVNLDGEAIAVGQYVKKTSTKFSIPKGGYLGVVTIEGDLYEFHESVAVADVVDIAKQNRLIPTGAMNRPLPSPLITPIPAGYNLSGDSIFITWEETRPDDQVKGIDYTVKIIDRQENELINTTIRSNWLMLDVKPFFNDTDVAIINIRSKKTRSFADFVLTKKNSEKLKADLERLADHNDLEMLCAIYDLNKFQYDRNFIIYKMISKNYKPSWMFEKYITSLTSQVNMK